METTTQTKYSWYNHPDLTKLSLDTMLKTSVSIVPINLMQSIKAELAARAIGCEVADFKNISEIEDVILGFSPFMEWLEMMLIKLPQPLDLELCIFNAARVVAFGCLMIKPLQERSDFFQTFPPKE